MLYFMNFFFKDLDECLANPCANGGECINSIASFTCKCPPGWTGPLCDIGKILHITNLFNILVEIYWIFGSIQFWDFTSITWYFQTLMNVWIHRVKMKAYARTFLDPMCVTAHPVGLEHFVRKVCTDFLN